MPILCVVLIFQEVDIIRKVTDWLQLFHDQLDIIIVENPSCNTETIIQPLCLKLLNDKKIRRYYLMEKNVVGNAFHIVLDDMLHNEPEFFNPAVYKYTMITDGDLIHTKADWLDETVDIIESDPNIFAVASSLDPINLPLKSFPEAWQWCKSNDNHPKYQEIPTGVHLVLFRTDEFQTYLRHRSDQNEQLLDTLMMHYCACRGRKWVATKKCQAIHLTWDLYHDLDHPYTKMKVASPCLFHPIHLCKFTCIKN
jgi:hypothetical protein